MPSLEMPLKKYERWGGSNELLLKEQIPKPGPGEYDPYPFLNSAAHQHGDAHYYPDRRMQYLGTQAYGQQPFYLSLPTKEQNKFWHRHRKTLDLKKKKEFINKAGGEFSTKQALMEANASLDALVYTNRDLPMGTAIRYPATLGNWSLMKHVQSEPLFEKYNNSGNASTLPAEKRRDLQKSFVLHRGKKKFRNSIMQAGPRRLTNLIMLASQKKKQEEQDSKRTIPKDDIRGWYIPPLPKEEGVGDHLANRSLKHYKTNARAREIDMNRLDQTLA